MSKTTEEQAEALLFDEDYIQLKKQEKTESIMEWFKLYENIILLEEERSGYKVVTENCIGVLQKSVWELIKEGWKPIGGVLNTNNGYFAQAMVKEV